MTAPERARERLDALVAEYDAARITFRNTGRAVDRNALLAASDALRDALLALRAERDEALADLSAACSGEVERIFHERDAALAAMSADTADVVLAKCAAESALAAALRRAEEAERDLAGWLASHDHSGPMPEVTTTVYPDDGSVVYVEPARTEGGKDD